MVLALFACGDEGDSSPAAGEPRASKGAAERTTRERSTPSVAERRAPQPTRIEIAAIGVSAPVIELGLNPDRTLEVPQDYSEAGWWSGGPEPGERGAAVIAGHVDSKRGPAIFYELDQLETGDKVLVERVDGSVVSFAVIGMERHSKDDFPTQRVYGQTSAPTLRLVTCSGDFNEGTGHYEDNTIVFLGRA